MITSRAHNCLECKFCHLSPYSHRWSERTPSEPMSITCTRGVWMSGSDAANSSSKGEMLSLLDLAIGCALFEPDPDLEQNK